MIFFTEMNDCSRVALKFIIILLSLTDNHLVFAQTGSLVQDSVRRKAGAQVKVTMDSNRIFRFTFTDTAHQALDSSLHYFHRSPIQQWWQWDLGNFGTGSQSLIFTPSLSIQNRLGIQAMDPLLISTQRLWFYHTTHPYSSLYYRIGSKQEQILELLHTQNINPRWNVSVLYRKLGSPGAYRLQRTNHDQLHVTTQYRSENGRYQLMGALNYAKLQQDENGGVADESLLSDPAFTNRRLLPVVMDPDLRETNRSSFTNYYRELRIQLEQTMTWGKKDSVWLKDRSRRIQSYKPRVGVKHTLYTLGSVYKMKDLSPDSLRYLPAIFLNSSITDSVYTMAYLTGLGNRLALFGQVPIFKQQWCAEAAIGLEADRYSNIGERSSWGNQYVEGILQQASPDSRWHFKANSRVYVTGNLQGNTQLEAQLTLRSSKPVWLLTIQGGQWIQVLPLTWNRMVTNRYVLESVSSSRPLTTRIQIGLQNIPRNFQLKISQWLCYRQPYRDSMLITKTWDQGLRITQVELSKRWQWRHWVTDHQGTFQWLPDSSPIHLPKWISIHRFAYESQLFDKKLHMATGIEGRIITAYQADDYNPLIMGFVTQYSRSFSYTPRLNIFFNFRIKSFKATLSMDDVQQYFAEVPIHYARYPAPNPVFRFGFQWAFMN